MIIPYRLLLAMLSMYEGGDEPKQNFNNIFLLKQVNLDKLPKKEKGFEFEYVDFILGPEEEAIVQIGWVPSNGTPLREVILAKFGKHHAQIKLIATCKAPMDKVKVQADTVIQADFFPMTPIITTVKSY